MDCDLTHGPMNRSQSDSSGLSVLVKRIPPCCDMGFQAGPASARYANKPNQDYCRNFTKFRAIEPRKMPISGRLYALAWSIFRLFTET
jgi:hypothetical protein